MEQIKLGKLLVTEAMLVAWTIEVEKRAHWRSDTTITTTEDATVMNNDFRISHVYENGIYGFKLEAYNADTGEWGNATPSQIQDAITKCEWALAFLTPPGQ